MTALKVKKIDEEAFAGLESTWRDLLLQSDADPLFMSWPWLYSWWNTWGHELGLELLLLCVSDTDDNLVGIAPLYRHRLQTRIGIPVVRLHFLGNARGISPTVRTEYTGLIACRGSEQAVALAVSSFLKKESWDELVICDAVDVSLNYIRNGFQQAGAAVEDFSRNETQGIRINTAVDFDHWLSLLGRNTRLKAYNRRSIFKKELDGNLSFVGSDPKEQIFFFEQLNKMHIRRWGKPCFDPRALVFHLDFLGRLSDNQIAKLSILTCKDLVVAAQYDVQAADRRYNLQSGFEEHFDPRISLGTLHFGYAIESAFRDDHVAYYDLLAGQGKNTFFKERFKGVHVYFHTRHYARNNWLRLIYRSRGHMPVFLRKAIKKILKF